MAYCIFVVVVAFVAVGGLFRPSSGCSMPVGWRPRSTVEKILDASDVLYGQVRRTYVDARFDYGGSGGSHAYTAEIDVYCVLKGSRTNAILNITEAGIIPGLCHSTNLTVGGRYVILVRRDDGRYTPTSVQIDATTQEGIDNVMTACGLQPVYPKGVEESTAAVKCPTPAPAGQCKSKSDFEPGSSSNDGGQGQERVSAVHAGRSRAVTATATFHVSIAIAIFAGVLNFVSH